MGSQYHSKLEKRLLEISRQEKLMGIDYLEVSEDQHKLFLHFTPKAPEIVTPDNIKISGGARVSAIRVKRVDVLSGEQIVAWVDDNDEFTRGVGDFSTYTLSLVNLDNIDPLLSQIDFSFKVGCLGDFDCKKEISLTTETLEEPRVDYLSKDYSSFRRLMLDRLTSLLPEWKEQSPADLGVAVVEVLAYAADYLSYYQDAVATEAYLGTARKRRSIRRHARLLDYPMHDGCNSRVWVAIQVRPNADGKKLSGPSEDQPGTRFITRVDGVGKTVFLTSYERDAAFSLGAQVFESMEDVTVYSNHNEIHFYTWGEEVYQIPEGATSATLDNEGNCLEHLKCGNVLIFEEVKGPDGGGPDPEHRHVIRLTGVEFCEDPLLEKQVANIRWSDEDALPFSMQISDVIDGECMPDISVARGNVVLADHGYTLPDEALPEPGSKNRYHPMLSNGPLTHQGHARDRLGRPIIGADGEHATFDKGGSAKSAFEWELQDATSAITLKETPAEGDESSEGDTWFPRRDLLNSGRTDREFVAETDEEGIAQLRFGDGIAGMRPVGPLKARYRVGNGKAGNVGAESIGYISIPDQGDDDSTVIGEDVREVRNPIAAGGGTEPEPADQVRHYAPSALKRPERAVTEDDYAEIVQQHPEVQKAIATFRWTGSWYTVFINVDRKGGRQIDSSFAEVLYSLLDRFRMAGFDLKIEGPVFVPLDIALTVFVSQDQFRVDVEKSLLEEFSCVDLPDGRRGFFHPDNFTFNQPVYLSRVVSRAMQVPGVQRVEFYNDYNDSNGNGDGRINRFQRLGEAYRGEIEAGKIDIGRMEIARLDNDPNNPENGLIEFFMEGGR